MKKTIKSYLCPHCKKGSIEPVYDISKPVEERCYFICRECGEHSRFVGDNGNIYLEKINYEKPTE